MLHIPALWYFDTSVTYPQWFRRVKFVLIPPRFVQQQYLLNIVIQPAVGCYNWWANIQCSGLSPLGEIRCETGLLTHRHQPCRTCSVSGGKRPNRMADISLLQWRRNGRDGGSNHRRIDCLLNRSFMRRSKKTSKLLVTGLCEGNSSVTGEFPAQGASIDNERFPRQFLLKLLWHFIQLLWHFIKYAPTNYTFIFFRWWLSE